MKEWKKEGMGMWNRKKTIIIAGCSRFGAGLAGELSEHGDEDVYKRQVNGGVPYHCVTGSAADL